MLGKLIKETSLFDCEYFKNALASSAKNKPELGELNAKAFMIGYNYAD